MFSSISSSVLLLVGMKVGFFIPNSDKLLSAFVDLEIERTGF